jgi:hypothetical protein
MLLEFEEPKRLPMAGARSNSTLTATRKGKYKSAPNSAETAYRMTIALVNAADGTARTRRQNESGRLRAGIHAAKV